MTSNEWQKRHILCEMNNCIERMGATCQQQVTVHRQHNRSANSSIFTGRHLHLAMLSAVQPTHTYILARNV